MKTLALATAVLAVVSIGCSNARQQQQQAETAQKQAESAQKSADQVQQGAEAMAKGFADLAKSLNGAGGDAAAKPVDPVSFKDLEALLPELPGWERDKPSGERMTAPVTYAEASVSYKKGDSEITAKITDSAFNQVLVAPLAMMLAANYSHETDSGYEKGIKVGDLPGFEKFDKDAKSGDVTVVVNKRFIVEIEGRQIDDVSVLHTALDRMDLKKLSDLK
jgi:hypothetical protein